MGYHFLAFEIAQCARVWYKYAIDIGVIIIDIDDDERRFVGTMMYRSIGNYLPICVIYSSSLYYGNKWSTDIGILQFSVVFKENVFILFS